MNKICEKCIHDKDHCTMRQMSCPLIENKIRITELNLAKPYLNSNYYWKRLKELNGEEVE